MPVAQLLSCGCLCVCTSQVISVYSTEYNVLKVADHKMGIQVRPGPSHTHTAMACHSVLHH